MIQKRKRDFRPYIALLLLLWLMGFFFAGALQDPEKSFSEIYLALIRAVWQVWRWPSYFGTTLIAIWGVILIGWLLLMANVVAMRRDTHGDIEHGSAEWLPPEKANREMEDTEHPLDNRILSKNLRIALSGKRSLSNNNGIYVGSPGTGKTLFEITPNLLLRSASYILLDVKGELLMKYGNYMKAGGYRIKVLNLREMEKSDRYNPFRYIHREDDIPKLITNIFASVEPPDATKNDPFWDDGCALYLQAIFYFVWMVPRREKMLILRRAGIGEPDRSPDLSEMPEFQTPTMNQVNLLATLETTPAVRVDRNGHPMSTSEPYTMLNKLTDLLAEEDVRGDLHPCVRDYRKLKGGAQETVRSIILILNAKLKFFNSPPVKRIFSGDDMELEFLGAGADYDQQTKTALFLVVEENNTSYNFIVNMLYQQLFDTLIRTADRDFQGPLPIRVEAWMDEFANGVRPERFENLITTLRSRNVAAMVFLQSISQLQTIYKGEAWKTIFDACSSFVFLGCGPAAQDTQKFVSELLGNATIEKQSDSVSMGQRNDSLSNDRMQRPLMTPDEVGRLPGRQCIIKLAGHQPILDDKYFPFEDENYKEAISMGPYEHPVQVIVNEDGSMDTVKTKGYLKILEGKAVEHYRKAEGVTVLDLDDLEEIIDIELPPMEEVDWDEGQDNALGEQYQQAAEAALQRQQEEKLRQHLEYLMGKQKTSGTVQESVPSPDISERNPALTEEEQMMQWLEELEDYLEPAQVDEILLGYRNGLSLEEISQYITLPAARMRRIRLLREAGRERRE